MSPKLRSFVGSILRRDELTESDKQTQEANLLKLQIEEKYAIKYLELITSKGDYIDTEYSDYLDDIKSKNSKKIVELNQEIGTLSSLLSELTKTDTVSEINKNTYILVKNELESRINSLESELIPLNNPVFLSKDSFKSMTKHRREISLLEIQSKIFHTKINIQKIESYIK